MKILGYDVGKRESVEVENTIRPAPTTTNRPARVRAGWIGDIDVLKIALPCGGEISLAWIDFAPAGSEDDVNVLCTPKVYCPKSYSDGQGCPWFDRLWKLNPSGTLLNESKGKRLVCMSPGEPSIKNADRDVEGVGYVDGQLIVFCGNDCFYDRQIVAKATKKTNDLAYECRYVNAEHGVVHSRIIAFFKKLFYKLTHNRFVCGLISRRCRVGEWCLHAAGSTEQTRPGNGL